MTIVPWWARLSSGLAPLVLIGGWALGAALQPASYTAVDDSISALAADGAAYPWLMTGALYLLGACYLATALGLRPAAMPGRVVLACAGAVSMLVALSPEPPGGTSLRHMVTTGIGFTLLALFPVLAAQRGTPSPVWALRPAVGYTVTVLMTVGAAWFLIELHGHGAAGVAERVLTGAQSLWPFVIVVSCVVGPRLPAEPIVSSRRDAGQGDAVRRR